MPTTWEYRGDVLLVVAEGLDTPDEWHQAQQEATANMPLEQEPQRVRDDLAIARRVAVGKP